tara:strand:+ start:680 stop:2695 length:2016 start_codon:yes stop_codon:yes gene_type:complete
MLQAKLGVNYEREMVQMDSQAIRRKIEKALERMPEEQVVQFGWRCAVRALPFLGSTGNFDFWKEKDRQKYLYSIFKALDATATATVTPSLAVAAHAAAAAATAEAFGSEADYASAVASISSSVSKAFDLDSNYVSAALAASISASSAVGAYATSAYALTVSTAATAATAVSNTITYATDSALNCNIDLLPILLEELQIIQQNGELFNSIEIYGEIWSAFQEALLKEGCEYWGKLYEGIFRDGFKQDKKALKQRRSVPEEIGERGAAAVANYLEELEVQGATRLNEARVIILGEKGAGKTCVARKLIDPNAPMTTPDESTAGVNTSVWRLEEEKINVSIWDFAGHTVTHAVHQFFLSERCLYLLVYDGRSEDRNRLTYWLDHMKNYGGDSKAIILVNKRDGHAVDIPVNLLNEHYPIAGVFTIDVEKEKNKLSDFRKFVAGYIQNNPSWENQVIPTNYFLVKEEMEQLFVKGEEKGKEHITKEKFIDIAKKHEVENVEELLQDLHHLGVSLWYKEMAEFDTLVLNPEWLSQGVYKIINRMSIEKRHFISLADFDSVFNDDASRYPQEKYPFLFNLIERYELGYKTNEDGLIIPHLLKEDRPKKLPEFSVGDSLMLRYKAVQELPSHSISRFIVRHNKEIKREQNEDVVWRYGVVLKDGKGSTALVRERRPNH